MKRSINDYETLPCPRCGIPVRPSTLRSNNAVRYYHKCVDGNHHSWTINEDGDIANELTT